MTIHRKDDLMNRSIFLRSLRKLLAKINLRSMAALMVVAAIVGLGTGFIALLFIKAIQWVTDFSFTDGLPQILAPLGSAWIVVVPVIGALISGPIIAYWAIEAKGHGVPEVMQAIVMKAGRIRPRVALVKSLASTICIGTGGSAGREGPIVQVGAALGSTIAQLMRLGPERTISLVACGAAAGIAATFNAPVAGVIFAMEVILAEFTTTYFGTVVVSAVAASIVSRHFLGANPAFAIPSYTMVSAWELPMYALLSILAALLGWLFVTVLYFLEDRFDPWRFPNALKPVVGAVVVGGVALLYPEALGSGLPAIEEALKGTFPWTLLLALVFAKLVATSFTLGSGNSGGIFAPSLFMGAMLGGAFGHGVHHLFPDLTASAGAYALVGMASVFAAAAHAPLTAFLIVFEMSGDYRMILPLMVTVGLSTLISQQLRRQSIYTLKLAKRGIPMERERDVDVMRGLTVGEVMTNTPDVVRGDMSLQELADVFTRTHHHGFPVLDAVDRFLGMVTIQDLERTTARTSILGMMVSDITQKNVVVAYPDEPLSKALQFMSDRDVGRIPVVDREDTTHLVGLLRRQNIVRAYRHAILKKLENQHRRESLRLGSLTDMEVLEVPLSEGMAAVGKCIMDLNLPSQALITTVRRDDRIIIAHGETMLQAGDIVIVLLQQNLVDTLQKLLTGDG
jgi:CIC family chloride channel protein